MLRKFFFALLVATACSRPNDVRQQLEHPQTGDVYVVQFQAEGRREPRYYFYHVYRVAPDSVYLHPARQDAATPDADLRQLAYEPTAKSLAYTRAELLALLKEQPGDPTKSKLVRVRRP